MKKVFLSLLLLMGCGIPDASSFETLLAPIIIDDKGALNTDEGPTKGHSYPQCTVNAAGNLTVELKIMVYNTEVSFSGYNVYYSNSFSGLSELQTNLNNAVRNHIRNASSSSKIFNIDTEKTFIIKKQNTLPTIPASDPSIVGYNIQPTIALIKIENNPQGSYLSKSQYGFTVTAVSLPNVIESLLGNVITIDGTQATDKPTYCGGV